MEGKRLGLNFMGRVFCFGQTNLPIGVRLVFDNCARAAPIDACLVPLRDLERLVG
jgi:hypothetical protein